MAALWKSDDPDGLDEPYFEGHVPRECGEHRTLGSRAWCLDCSQYCYPNIEMACRGCEIADLRLRLPLPEVNE